MVYRSNVSIVLLVAVVVLIVALAFCWPQFSLLAICVDGRH
jgi:hypothetical protein